MNVIDFAAAAAQRRSPVLEEPGSDGAAAGVATRAPAPGWNRLLVALESLDVAQARQRVAIAEFRQVMDRLSGSVERLENTTLDYSDRLASIPIGEVRERAIILGNRMARYI